MLPSFHLFSEEKEKRERREKRSSSQSGRKEEWWAEAVGGWVGRWSVVSGRRWAGDLMFLASNCCACSGHISLERNFNELGKLDLTSPSASVTVVMICCPYLIVPPCILTVSQRRKEGKAFKKRKAHTMPGYRPGYQKSCLPCLP